MPTSFTVYIASSFRHLHAVQLLSRVLRAMGTLVPDWTEKGTPPEGLSPAERRAWMDTDRGGTLFRFCAQACTGADVVIYLGASGQDAGVEVGMAAAAGVPVLGIRGPLESPGLMLHGAVDVWVNSAEEALRVMETLVRQARDGAPQGTPGPEARRAALRAAVDSMRKSGEAGSVPGTV